MMCAILEARKTAIVPLSQFGRFRATVKSLVFVGTIASTYAATRAHAVRAYLPFAGAVGVSTISSAVSALNAQRKQRSTSATARPESPLTL